MKVVTSIKRRCKDCRLIRRGKTVYVRCKTFPRHKQRQGKFSTFVRLPIGIMDAQYFSPEQIKPVWMNPMTQAMVMKQSLQL